MNYIIIICIIIFIIIILNNNYFIENFDNTNTISSIFYNNFYPSNNNYIYIGPYKDKGLSDSLRYLVSSDIVNNILGYPNPKSINDVIKVAKYHNAPIFSITNNNQIYLENNLSSACKYGPDPNLCRKELGCTNVHQIYVNNNNFNLDILNLLTIPANNTYIFFGGYGDGGGRAIPYQVPDNIIRDILTKKNGNTRIITKEDGMTIANYFNAPLFGLQNGSAIFLGYNLLNAINYGPRQSKVELGGAWQNQIYIAQN